MDLLETSSACRLFEVMLLVLIIMIYNDLYSHLLSPKTHLML